MIHKYFTKMNPRGLLMVVTLLILVVFSRSSVPARTTVNYSRLQDIYVIDGDTLKATLSGRSTSIRLIGLDAPETTNNERASKQAAWWRCSIRDLNAAGERVKIKLKELLKDQLVMIKLGAEQTDRYGRTLGYIYVKHTTQYQLVNLSLLASGLTKRLRAGENDELSLELDQAEDEARKRGLGLWGKKSPCRF